MSEFVLQATARGVPVHHVERRELDALCRGQVHQGVCLEATPLRFKSLEEAEKTDLGDEGRPNQQLIWLVLEQIQDPMNLGALLRSAYFLGVDRVVTSQRNRYGVGCLLFQLFSVFSFVSQRGFSLRCATASSEGFLGLSWRAEFGSLLLCLALCRGLWDVLFQASKEPPWLLLVLIHFVFQLSNCAQNCYNLFAG